jgi:GTP-binding protein Era
MSEAETRCGFIAIIGAPNAGKSTLLNRLTGAKLSIVTPKAQTTRARVLGILMRGTAQIWRRLGAGRKKRIMRC